MSETALALVQSITAVEFFKPGASKDLIDKVITEATELAATFDVSTPAGEAGIRSLAAKLAKVRNRLDDEGKNLVAGKKAEIKLVDVERGVVWYRLEAAQKTVRQPLTDKEAAEASRIAGHEAAIAALVESGAHVERNWQAMSVEDMRGRLAEITNSQSDWQEFLARARQACATTIGQIKTAIAQRDKLDADAAELEQLRTMEIARQKKEAEEEIARKAREAAEAVARKREEEQRSAAERERQRVELERAEAEAKAKQAEAQRVAAEAKAVQDAIDAAEALRVEQERAQEAAKQAEAQRAQEAAAAAEALRTAQEEARLAAEQAERTRIATEEAARLAEQRRVEAEERAAREAEEVKRRHAEEVEAANKLAESAKKAAAEKGEADRKASVEAERVRIEAEQKAEAERIAEETRKRQANIKHRAKINNEAKHAIAATCNLTDEQAMSVVVAIAKGQILHTKISY